MTESNTGWATPRDEAGEHVGFNNSGLEHFNDDPLGAAAKELPQNSRDNPKDSTTPVHIDVNVIMVPVQDFPDAEGLKETMERCLPNAALEGEKATRHFKRASEILDGDGDGDIPVLAHSDFNTKGMKGPSTKGNPFHTFMKANGTSLKPDDQGLGSFGIGKNAPYACSDLRTVIVSTAYEDEDGDVCRLVQGKSFVISHEDRDGVSRSGNTYWGQKDGFNPINPDTDPDAVPAWITKPHQNGRLGTTVFVPGFIGDEGWDKLFIAQFLSTYFVSVLDGTMTANIGGTDINASTIGDLFADPAIEAYLVDMQDVHERFIAARAYHKALTADEAESLTGNYGRLGQARLDLVLSDGLPKRVAIIRNGMLITDRLPLLKRFPAMADFSAVLRFETAETNALLRRSEPPRHDDFTIKRLKDDPVAMKHLELGLKEAAAKVRKEIEERARGETTECLNATELSDVLGEPDDGSPKAAASDINPLGRLKLLRAARILSQRGRRKTTIRKAVLGGQDQSEVINSGNKPRRKPSRGRGGTGGVSEGPVPEPEAASAQKDGTHKIPGKGESEDLTDFAIHGIRGVRASDGSYKVSFVPPMDSTFGLIFERVGYAKTDDPLKVERVDVGKIGDKGMVRMPGVAGQKVSLSVQFADKTYNGAVKVRSYAV